MGSRRDGNNTFLFLIFWGYTVWHLVTWKRVPRCTGLVGRARPVLFSAGGLTGNYYKPTIRDTRADPAEPRRTLDDMESPAAPVGEAGREQSWAAGWVALQDRTVDQELQGPRKGLRPRDPSQPAPLFAKPPGALLSQGSCLWPSSMRSGVRAEATSLSREEG